MGVARSTTSVWIVMLGGCELAFPLEGPSGPTCLGSGIVQLCVLESAPVFDVSASSQVFLDTDTAPECVPYTFTGIDPGACVIAADTIDIDGTIRGFGTKPLILVGRKTVTITGEINVSSVTTAVPGAGVDPPQCLVGLAGSSSGGGAGGSFGGTGGSGGGTGGSPGAPAVPDRLRGGCSGGGNASLAMGGSGGFGGGAVFVMAGELITLSGTIDASGAGGQGAFTDNSGGGGGGSGGMIGLDAPEISDLSSRIFANGGGGGSGRGTQGAIACNGESPSAPDVPAAGGGPSGFGCGSTDGGMGGLGAATTVLNGGNGSAQGTNGGGGGGGAGIIIVASGQALAGNVSPPPGDGNGDRSGRTTAR